MKIALIGLIPLQAYGLRAFIEKEYADSDVHIYLTAEEQGWQQADCYIVSASALAILARFLMSRLDRVLLITLSAPERAPMLMLSPTASEEDIRSALASLMYNCNVGDEEHPQLHSSLSARELDVLRLTASGFTSKKIANELCISQNTVLTHRRNIATKTGLHSVSAITYYAMVHGLLR